MHLLATLMSPPYELPSNIIYFHDWRYVNQGAFALWPLKVSGRTVHVDYDASPSGRSCRPTGRGAARPRL